GRVPVVISRDNRYFQDTYQGMPRDGYTPLFEKMLAHENIEVKIGVDASEVLPFDGRVIFTGAIDELFDYKFGHLPYRSLEFKFEHYDKDRFQSHAVVNYTVSEDYTRITEFKAMTGEDEKPGTTIIKEYPFAYTGADGEIPYYAINNPENDALYAKYKALADEQKNLTLLGRLAEYRYYNIDAIVDRALDVGNN
nr:UDP-galactopyranose mutase [Eubacterium sp.]